jgi:rhodanese-related sulfurtransferase
MLMSRGFRRVRPLEGGLEAWVEAGYAVARLEVQDDLQEGSRR